MKKVLLIEDRSKRQEMFQEKFQVDLSDYADILENVVYDKYDEIYEQLKNQEFDFTPYNIFMVHKSAFGDDNSIIIAYIERECKKHSIILIFFSGGIDANFYQKDGDFKLYEVNSKTFYSNNLLLFLNNYKENRIDPGLIFYGEHWQLNLLCNLLSILNIYIEKLKDYKEKEKYFYEDNPYLKNILFEMENATLYKPKAMNEEITKDEMKKLRDSIREYIDRRLAYE
ncbi:hypothetical protein [Sulfurimonas sp.]